MCGIDISINLAKNSTILHILTAKYTVRPNIKKFTITQMYLRF